MAGFHYDNVKGRISHLGVSMENAFVFDSTGSDTYNVFTTFSAAVAAVASRQGPRTLVVHGTATYAWPAGTYDLNGLTLIAASQDAPTITVGDGVTWTRMPSRILGMNVNFTNTLAAVYNQDGTDFDLTLDGNLSALGTTPPIVINDPAFDPDYAYLRLFGWSVVSGSVACIRLENAGSLFLVLCENSTYNANNANSIASDGGLGTNLIVEQRDVTVNYTPPPFNSFPQPGYFYPDANGKVAHLSLEDMGGLIIRADNTYSGLASDGRAGHVITIDPEWLNPGWRPALWTHMPVIQGFRIFPQGITGNDLLADGILTGLAITKSAVTTTLPAANNPSAIQANVSTAAVIGAEAGWITPVIGNRRAHTKVWFWFNVQNVTDIRFFIGLTSDTTRANNTGADSPVGAHMAGLQFSTVRGDTRWQFMVQDGVSQTLQPLLSTAAPATTGPYMLELILGDDTGGGGTGGTVYMRLYNAINGPSGAGAWQFTDTAAIPGRDTQLALVASITSLDGAVKTFGTMGVTGALGPA